MDTRTKIVTTLRSIAGKPIDASPDESLFDAGVLDSNSLVDLVGALETQFSIRIPDSDLTPRKFDSIARIEAYIQSRS
jgi:acyl carrier protein